MKTLEPQSNPTNQKMTSSISARKRRKSKVNAYISEEQRIELIELYSRTKSFRDSAKRLGIHESTAKSIYYKFARTGRIGRKVRKTKYTQVKREPPSTPDT